MTPARSLGFVHIADDNGLVWEYAVRTSDPRPGRDPSSRPTPAAPDAGPETSSGAAGTS